MKFFRALLLVVLLAQSLLPIPVTRAESAQPNEQISLSLQDETGIRRASHPQTGKLTFLGADPGQTIRVPAAMGPDLTPEARATSILEAYGPEFGIRDTARELMPLNVNKEEGHTAVRYQQVYRGIPILGGELVVNTREDGSLLSINGEVSPELNLNVEPAISAAKAKQIALQFLTKAYSLSKEEFTVSQPTLWIYDERLLQDEAIQPPHLVWRMEVTSQSVPLRELLLVNAQNGQISLHFNQIDTAWNGQRGGLAASVKAQTAKNTEAIPTEFVPSPAPAAVKTVEIQIGTPVPGTNLFVNGSSGNDANDCLYPASACQTINGAIAKTQAEGNTIYVTEGVYTPVLGSYGAAVTIDKNVNLSGGWDSSFSNQNGYTTLTGPGTGTGIYKLGTVSSAIEKIKITHFYTGIFTSGTLNASKIILSANNDVGIVANTSTLTIAESAIINNSGGGINIFGGTLNIANTTISNNTIDYGGGGIYSQFTNIVISNSTISHNTALTNNSASGASGGGIYALYGNVSLRNTILANNMNAVFPDCGGYGSTYTSLGYNIIGDTRNCSITATTGDQFNVDPRLGALVEPLGIRPLLASSPAIDRGDSSTCPAFDQRQVSRPQGAGCDIGAYEYTPADNVAYISIAAGNNQVTPPNTSFPLPLQVVAWDNDGDLVSGVTVDFTAPSSGPSAILDLTGTNTASVTTDENGIASVNLTANGETGDYLVNASVTGTGSVDFSLANKVWYVSASRGSDSNDCLTPATPCATINSAIQKASDGGTIWVETGVYTSSGTVRQVVSIDKNIVILGGWNTTFTSQTDYSTIDGNNTRSAVIVNSGNTVRIVRFIITNSGNNAIQRGAIDNSGTLFLSLCELRSNRTKYSGGAIRNTGTLSLDQCVITKNYAEWAGGGIYNSGIITINNTSINDNATKADPSIGGIDINGGGIFNLGIAIINNSLVNRNIGGGISSYGQLTLINSSVSENYGIFGGGIAIWDNNTIIKNTTIFGNNAKSNGGGIFVGTNALATLNNVTISGNIAHSGGGIYIDNATSNNILIQNTILANNSITGGMGPNCYGKVTSQGYNIINSKANCTITTTTGDQIANPYLGTYLPVVGYQPLLSNSPAINAGNPTTCMPTDQRGLARVGSCDIGAYEYTTPGSPATIKISDGDDQHIAPNEQAQKPLQVVVLDNNGTPVGNVQVTFSAPTSGASVIFLDSGNDTTLSITNPAGIANANIRANGERGSYSVSAQTEVGRVEFNLSNILWFVSPTGNSINNCTSPATPCSHIIDVLEQSNFYPVDTIWLAAGTYDINTTNPYFTINKSATIVGGWNDTFTIQTGATILKDGIYISNTVLETKVNLKHLIIDGSTGIGITNAGATLVLENSTVKNSSASGITTIYSGNTTIVNSTISGNMGGGVISASTGKNVINLINSSIVNNTNLGAGGIQNEEFDPENTGIITLANSIVIGNRDIYEIQPDCAGPIISQGHNIVGQATCDANWSMTDLIGTKRHPIPPQLILDTTLRQDPTTGQWYHPLKLGSPAIDGGNTASPGSGKYACPTTDQLGVPRPQGAYCDIGAVEFRPIVNPPTSLLVTYSANHTSSLPGTPICASNNGTCSGSDTHAQAATRNAYSTYQWYQTWHGRNSIDNNGMQIISTVRYKSNYPNAFWNGYMMVYGDAYGFPLADDVVAHELTHGVTQYESNLFYWYQSGAINESLSDLWGEAVDQANGLGNDSPAAKWLIGEDVSGLGAIRNMANPPAFNQPDSMTSPQYCKSGPCLNDNGGVHTNSGVNNKAAYLMINGGTFNGITVAPLGWSKVLTIYYEAQTNLLTSGADYLDLYNVLYQACLNKVGTAGIQTADCQQVRRATQAVKMNQQPTANFNPRVTASCPAGMTKYRDLYVEDFESGSDGWQFTALSKQSSWGLAAGYAHSGTTMIWGDGSYKYLDSVAMMTSSVSLPANEKAFLHFSHAFLFEQYANYYFDGGVLEYSTNGKTWLDAKPLFSGGKNYGGVISTLYGNRLKGRNAFVGDSHGYVQSRYNLSSLAGKSVRFRWRIGTDAEVPSFGWFVDDVRIYTCVPIPSVPSLLLPTDNALTRDYTPTLDWSDSTPANALSHYELQLATNSTFTTGLMTLNNLSTSTYTPASDLLPNQKYYWRVRAYNIAGGKSAWSAVRSFRTALLPPTSLAPGSPLPNPADNIHILRPTFAWDPVPGAAGYVLEVSTIQNFATKIINTPLTTTSFTPGQDLAANTIFYWRVRATGANGPSANSVIRTFTTGNPPSVPTLVSPANNALVQTPRPTFDWQSSTLPTGTTFKYYEIQMDTSNTFPAPLTFYTTPGDINESTYTPTSDLLPATTYYWRVRAWNDADDFSQWSAVRSIRIAYPAPILSEPAEGTTVSNLTPIFAWGAVPGTSSYQIQISTSSNFSTSLVDTTISDPTYTPTTTLPSNQTLYWRVGARGPYGPGSWSAVWSFTTP